MTLLLTTPLFLALVWLHFALLWRLLAPREALSFGEKIVAAFTFLFYNLSALGFLLGYLGMFRIGWLIAGLALLNGAGYFAVRKLPAAPLCGELGIRFTAWLTDLPFAIRVVVACAAFAALSFLYIGVRLPVVDYDGLSYHLGLAVHMYQDGDFRYYPGETGLINHFARGGELLMGMLIMLTGSILLVNSLQWMILPPLCLSVYTMGRTLGLSNQGATLSAAGPLAVPVILYQTTMTYVDLWSLGWFVIGMSAVIGAVRFRKLDPVRVIWMFTTAGLALAAKYNAVTPALIMGVTALIVWGPRPFLLRKWRAVIVGFLLSAAIGLCWPATNWVRFGSPIYPYSLEFGPVMLAEAVFPMESIRLMPEAPPYDEMPLIEKAWLAWTWIDFESWERIGPFGARMAELSSQDLHDPGFGYRGDNKEGGLGAAWLVLYFPAMVGMLFAAWFLPERTVRQRLAAFLMAALPLVAFQSIVASWWPRFSLFLPVFGALCFFLFWEWIRGWSRVAGWAFVSLFFVVAGFDWATAVFQNRDREKIRRYYREAQPATLAPIHFFTWIDSQHPEWRAIRALVDEARPGETVTFHTPGAPTFNGFFVDGRARVRVFPFPAMWPPPDIFTHEELMEFIDNESIALVLSGPTSGEEFRDLLERKQTRVLYDQDGFRVYEVIHHRRTD